MANTKTKTAKKSKAKSVRGKAGAAPKSSSKRTSRVPLASTKSKSSARAKSAAKAARARFESDLITRGEAARADTCGDLPSGATHEICEAEGEGQSAASKIAQIKRRRFSVL